MEIEKKSSQKRVKGEISSRVNRIKNKNDEIIGIKHFRKSWKEYF